MLFWEKASDLVPGGVMLGASAPRYLGSEQNGEVSAVPCIQGDTKNGHHLNMNNFW